MLSHYISEQGVVRVHWHFLTTMCIFVIAHRKSPFSPYRKFPWLCSIVQSPIISLRCDPDCPADIAAVLPQDWECKYSRPSILSSIGMCTFQKPIINIGSLVKIVVERSISVWDAVHVSVEKWFSNLQISSPQMFIPFPDKQGLVKVHVKPNSNETSWCSENKRFALRIKSGEHLAELSMFEAKNNLYSFLVGFRPCLSFII